MGYRVKMQKVERPTNKSFYVNFPASLADSCQITKGEEMEWLVHDRNTFLLTRKKKVKSLLKK
jgi:antitoxin component of MazEF toxin-antitoxin module